MSSTDARTLTDSVPSDAFVLRAEDLNAGYGKKQVLRGVSLQVRKGEVVALIGPNGAGKSTLLKAIAGLVRVSCGQIFLNGRDLTALPTHLRARQGLAYFMQGGAIFPSLRAKDHIALSSWVTRSARLHGRKTTPAWPLPEFLADRREPAGLFSGGQRHALALATVLAKPPALLLCDEPSAGLAPAATRELLQRLERLVRDLHVPVLCWVEQRIADILPLADRAILLRDGRTLAETNEPRRWLSADVLAEITFGDAAK